MTLEYVCMVEEKLLWKAAKKKMLQKHYARRATKNGNAFGKLNGEANSDTSMGINAVWCPVGHRRSLNTLGDLD